MEEYSEYVGLDVHKDTIAVAVESPGRSKPKSLGIIANNKRSILKLIGKLSPNGEALGFCYLLVYGDEIQGPNLPPSRLNFC